MYTVLSLQFPYGYMETLATRKAKVDAATVWGSLIVSAATIKGHYTSAHAVIHITKYRLVVKTSSITAFRLCVSRLPMLATKVRDN
jgi:hypothetical protein